ncbi:hypothetical protein [Roseateles terrae]|uniref:Uncharacterized protein n=1 Tax=Roseateles terrae TaxID=431060 RepID=A0ABR6GVH4_9BURK|nr:hypothetical protein [Roseateles terrae]MBB3196103.1 hypothetical protein [Roseateles terrae]OWQ85428.1 hypothetical protein CDN98_16000 [Roseateles terrae]
MLLASVVSLAVFVGATVVLFLLRPHLATIGQVVSTKAFGLTALLALYLAFAVGRHAFFRPTRRMPHSR